VRLRHTLRKNKWKDEGINNEKKGAVCFKICWPGPILNLVSKTRPHFFNNHEAMPQCVLSWLNRSQLLAPDRATLIGCIRMHDRRAPMCSCSLLLHFFIWLLLDAWIADKQYEGLASGLGLGKHRQTLANCSKQRALHALVLWLSCGGRWSHRGALLYCKIFSTLPFFADRCIFWQIKNVGSS